MPRLSTTRAGLDLRHVARWVSGIRPDEPELILHTTPGAAHHLADQLATISAHIRLVGGQHCRTSTL